MSPSESTPKTSRSTPRPRSWAHLLGFLDYLQVECGLAKSTLEAYGRDLGEFAAYVESRRLCLAQLSYPQLQQYLIQLKDRGLAHGPDPETRAEAEDLTRRLAQDPVPWLVGLACLVFLVVVAILAVGE